MLGIWWIVSSPRVTQILGYHVLYSIYTRDMMDCVLASSEVDLGLPHSLEYLYQGHDGLHLTMFMIEYVNQECFGITFYHIHGVICVLRYVVFIFYTIISETSRMCSRVFRQVHRIFLSRNKFAQCQEYQCCLMLGVNN